MAARNEAKNLPFLLTIAIGLVVAFMCDKVFGFPWWLRLVALIAVALLTEGVNQVARRCFQRVSR
ncbi:hypothetical protein [Streptomyces sp. NPDC050600]|uniref:hypothetical protein n=1 Tax=Streptomyces sp. NPDC050600 TaxID=3157213 RepID=UPI00341A7F8D